MTGRIVTGGHQYGERSSEYLITVSSGVSQMHSRWRSRPAAVVSATPPPGPEPMASDERVRRREPRRQTAAPRGRGQQRAQRQIPIARIQATIARLLNVVGGRLLGLVAQLYAAEQRRVDRLEPGHRAVRAEEVQRIQGDADVRRVGCGDDPNGVLQRLDFAECMNSSITRNPYRLVSSPSAARQSTACSSSAGE